MNAYCTSTRLFQSTHPVRGATDTVERDDLTPDISIHAPREGCDLRTLGIHTTYDKFQSTHPVRGATMYIARPDMDGIISIHAPREGCDYT